MRIRELQQHLFPDITFTCNGSITKWIVGAEADNGDALPELQIWRNTGGSNYTKAHFSYLSSGTPDSKNIVEYTLSTPLEFHEGDILGVYQPSRLDSALVVYYQERDGPANFQNDMLDSVTTAIPHNQYDYPLVTVEINTGKLMLYNKIMRITMIALSFTCKHYYLDIQYVYKPLHERLVPIIYYCYRDHYSNNFNHYSN